MILDKCPDFSASTISATSFLWTSSELSTRWQNDCMVEAVESAPAPLHVPPVATPVLGTERYSHRPKSNCKHVTFPKNFCNLGDWFHYFAFEVGLLEWSTADLSLILMLPRF